MAKDLIINPVAVAISVCMGAVLSSAPAAGQTFEADYPVPETVRELRRHMNDADVSSLTFRTIDTIMNTRTVHRSGPVWKFDRQSADLDFTYSYEGVVRPANDALTRTFTNALLIMKDGKIVFEHYLNNSDERDRFISWSMSKSITSILIGIAIEEKLIMSVDDKVTRYVPELAGTGYSDASIKDLLQMRSGIDFEERYDFHNPSPHAEAFEMAMVRDDRDYAQTALTVAAAEPAGETFEYRTLDTAVLGWVLSRATGSSITDFTASRLWSDLGAEGEAAWLVNGPPGGQREFNGAGFIARLRDYGRIGQMMLNGGVADGRRIVSEAWVDESTAPSSSDGQTAADSTRGLGYGYQWWTVPGTDAYTAVGLQGQFIFVDPETQTVVVKLSYFPPGDEEASRESIAFLRAISDWNPKGRLP